MGGVTKNHMLHSCLITNKDIFQSSRWCQKSIRIRHEKQRERLDTNRTYDLLTQMYPSHPRPRQIHLHHPRLLPLQVCRRVSSPGGRRSSKIALHPAHPLSLRYPPLEPLDSSLLVRLELRDDRRAHEAPRRPKLVGPARLAHEQRPPAQPMPSPTRGESGCGANVRARCPGRPSRRHRRNAQPRFTQCGTER